MQSAKRVISACALVVLLVSGASTVAQQKPADPASVAMAKELLATMGVDKQLETMLPLMLQNMRGLIVQQKPSAQKEIDAALAAMAGKFSARRQELVDLMAVLYAERIPPDDLKAMTAFFATPAGKRFVAVQPDLMREGNAIGQQWGMKIGQEVDLELRQELKKRGVDL